LLVITSIVSLTSVGQN